MNNCVAGVTVLGPNSRFFEDLGNGGLARELPVARALPIRQELAHRLTKPGAIT